MHRRHEYRDVGIGDLDWVHYVGYTDSGPACVPLSAMQSFYEDSAASKLDGPTNARNRAYYSSDVFFYSAAGEVTIKGIEAEVAGSPLPGWNITAGYTYLGPDYRTEQDEANLSSITPKHNGKVWSNYHFQGGSLKDFNLGVGVLASSSFTSGNVHVPGYATLAAQIGYRIDTHWTAALDVRNALDRTYYQTFGGSGGFYGEPRGVMLTVRARY